MTPLTMTVSITKLIIITVSTMTLSTMTISIRKLSIEGEG
jgi:hypothetical protein